MKSPSILALLALGAFAAGARALAGRLLTLQPKKRVVRVGLKNLHGSFADRSRSIF